MSISCQNLDENQKNIDIWSHFLQIFRVGLSLISDQSKENNEGLAGESLPKLETEITFKTLDLRDNIQLS